ncbi:tRNA epoxyqueuosine(34) reductase QueG [Faecalibacter bovis]|uniref:Epoxyqueuosine reductase n=1 Tax=Faecalibacter bovis TaxID=2898187 RepID=A0ABX7XDR6_9FLAO|nr:tRNA epoxyqueuosine(34) reductase QueG [Faecalibacter bovis]QTV05996.1 tRNA epoxyqueuosine(34) reductase QueG [Faecalibacter bovis]
MHLPTEEHIKLERTQRIKAKAEALGFISCGVAKADFLEDEAPRLESWLNNNYQGEMSYMANHFDMRLDPRLLVDGAKSVISLAYNYYQDLNRNPDSYKIAMYAQGEDYHFVVKEKVRELLDFIQEEIGEVDGRAFTDSAPILEHAWATKAGIGWVGKNSLTLSKQKGSFFFLAELILDLDLIYDQPMQTDHCGKCTKCIDACPTEAILPNRVVNGSKCISYFTIELKDQIPNEMKGKFDDWIFGCDVCQEVCPWNRFSLPTQEHRFIGNENINQFSKKDWEEITEDVFRNIFKKSPVKRTKFNGLLRNIKFVKSLE